MRIGIINGPNLNLLGKREPEIYGDMTFDSFFNTLKEEFSSHELFYFQSNHEGEIIEKIQEWGNSLDGMVINPAAYTHTSVAIRDAILSAQTRVIEVHISNIFSREEFRHFSYVSGIVEGVISGMGIQGYRYAVIHLMNESN
jgi:3-dehydroquinate dehydratase-2